MIAKTRGTKKGMGYDAKVDYIRRQLDGAANDGHIPYCMDNADDRAAMAEWIADNILPL